MSESYALGQVWEYDAPRGLEDSRLVIGQILVFDEMEPVICCYLKDVPMLNPQGKVRKMPIPFLPFAKSAFDETITREDGVEEVADYFTDHYERWKQDQEGIGFIERPLKDLLQDLVAGLK